MTTSRAKETSTNPASTSIELSKRADNAIENDNAEEIHSLAKFHINLNKQIVFLGKPSSLIGKAIALNRHNALRALIEEKADLNQNNCDHRTPLVYSLRFKRDECAKILIEMKASLEPEPNHSKGPLAVAAAYGSREIIQYLIAAGSNIEQKSTHGATPLWRAIRHSNAQGAQLLCEAKASLNETYSSLALSDIGGYRHTRDDLIRKGTVWRILLRAGADSSAFTSEKREASKATFAHIDRLCAEEKNALNVILAGILIPDLINIVCAYLQGDNPDWRLPINLLSSTLQEQLNKACEASNAILAQSLLEYLVHIKQIYMLIIFNAEL